MKSENCSHVTSFPSIHNRPWTLTTQGRNKESAHGTCVLSETAHTEIPQKQINTNTTIELPHFYGHFFRASRQSGSTDDKKEWTVTASRWRKYKNLIWRMKSSWRHVLSTVISQQRIVFVICVELWANIFDLLWWFLHKTGRWIGQVTIKSQNVLFDKYKITSVSDTVGVSHGYKPTLHHKVDRYVQRHWNCRYTSSATLSDVSCNFYLRNIDFRVIFLKCDNVTREFTYI